MLSSPPSSSTGLSLGAAIDRYEVISALGKGGFGQVYRARHKHTRQIVALKVLRTRAARDPRALDQLFREARIMASIRHPNIVQVFDCGSEDGRAFVAMELVEGRTLEDIIFDDGPLDAAKLLPLALQLFAGLAEAHSRGVIHRDIKPANLLVQANGTLKVLDFGISRADLDGAPSGASQLGAMAGTPGFMAPEQYAFEPIDARVDLYAAAVTLFAALSGRMPFSLDQTLPELVHKVLHERAPAMASVVPSVPKGLADAIDRGLARDPDARFRSATAFRDALLGEGFGPSVTRDGGQIAVPILPPHAVHEGVTRSAPPDALNFPKTAPLPFSPSPSAPPDTAKGSTLEPGSTTAPTRTSSPGWVLAGVAVGAFVLVAGAVLGALVSEARAKKDGANASHVGGSASAPAPSGAIKELADQGIYINPAVIEKTGTFTTTQICEGPNDLKFVNATFNVKNGPAVLVLHGCSVELVSPTIRATVGIQLQHAGVAIVRGGTIVAETSGVDFDGAKLDMQDTRVEAVSAIRQSGVGEVKLRKVKLVGSSFGYVASSSLETVLDDVTIEAPIGLQAEGGTFKLRSSSIKSTTYAINVGGVAVAELSSMTLYGPTRKRDLAEIHDGTSQKAKPLSRDEPLVRVAGLSVTVPQANPEGLDVGAFARAMERAAPKFLACGAKKGESIRLLVTVKGPEIAADHQRIGSVLPWPQGPVGDCVVRTFRSSVPDPWREAGDTRSLIFSIAFD